MNKTIISGEDMLNNIKNDDALLSGVVKKKISDSHCGVKSVGFSRLAIKDLKEAIKNLPDDMAVYLDDITFEEDGTLECVSYIRIRNKNGSIFSNVSFYDMYGEVGVTE